MRARWTICAWMLSISIGIPTATVAASQDCRKAVFESAWAKKVQAMVAWDNDPKNRAYVEKHKLKTADHSKATAALRARMLKEFDLACTVGLDDAAGSSALTTDLIQASPLDMVASLGAAASEQMLVPTELRDVIASQQEPGYDVPEMVYQGVDSLPRPGFGGFGGFVGGVGGIVPSTPVQVTPEPAPFALVFAGALLLLRIGGRA